MFEERKSTKCHTELDFTGVTNSINTASVRMVPKLDNFNFDVKEEKAK
jgi:hypothetical protein